MKLLLNGRILGQLLLINSALLVILIGCYRSPDRPAVRVRMAEGRMMVISRSYEDFISKKGSPPLTLHELARDFNSWPDDGFLGFSSDSSKRYSTIFYFRPNKQSYTLSDWIVFGSLNTFEIEGKDERLVYFSSGSIRFISDEEFNVHILRQQLEE